MEKCQLIIILGIVSGVFTPTESGIAACVYGLFYGFVMSRKLKFRKLPDILVRSANTTAIVRITLAMVGILSNVLIRLRFQTLVMDNILNGI